jgi:hypothetical protein
MEELVDDEGRRESSYMKRGRESWYVMRRGDS